MASLSTPLNVDEEIVRNFQSALEGGSIRFLQVEVENEQLVQKSTHNSSGNLGDDYDRMVDLVNEESACYFLFKVQPKEWLLITYVPDGVPVKDKMLYASAKGALKDRLGHSYLEEEIHTTTKEELSYDHYKGEKKPTDARSNFEIEHEKVIKEENEARDEMLKQAVQKEETGSGGFHSVTIPLAASAKSALDRFKSGEVNFVVLAVDDSKSSIISSDAKKIDTSRASAEIHTGEPRFYVLNQAGKPTVFIYCCPGRSPPKLRMVYSTSKPNVINQLTQYGLNLAAKKIEITEGEDLAEELKDAQTSTTIKPSLMKPGGANFTGRMIQPAPGSVPALGGTVKASNLPTMQNSGHSIYSLMVKPGTETASTKKKIVIPPRGAW